MKILYLLFLGVIISACSKPTPQLPSNKIIHSNSTNEYLLNYNQQLIQQEDSLIAAFIEQDTLNFKRNESGIWCETQDWGKQASTDTDSVVTVSFQARTIQGELLLDEDNICIKLGKKELPFGLEEAIKLSRKKKKSQFIIPSYLAYGIQGNEQIPPNTTLVFVIDRTK